MCYNRQPDKKYNEHTVDLFAENLGRYLNHDPLLNLVEREGLLIKGIIFDLGNTLIHMNRSWDTVSREGAEAMATWYLKKKHIKLDTEVLVETFLAERAAGFEHAKQTHTETLITETLLKSLQQIEAPPRAETMLVAAIKIFFEPEEAASQPYPDTVKTLKLLKKEGYQLSLYSNATDDFLIQRLVNSSGFRPWLAPTFSSAGCGWRKPKAEAFNLVAQRWGLPAEEIVVVGDTLNADILGAQNSGMYSILVTMQETSSNLDNQHIQPTFTANKLADIPALIKQL